MLKAWSAGGIAGAAAMMLDVAIDLFKTEDTTNGILAGAKAIEAGGERPPMTFFGRWRPDLGIRTNVHQDEDHETSSHRLKHHEHQLGFAPTLGSVGRCTESGDPRSRSDPV